MALSLNERNRIKTKYGPMALVTGASSGIGLELTKLLAACGLDLVINARNQTTLEALKTELESNYHINVVVAAADLSNEEELNQFIKTIHAYNIGLFVMSAGFGTSGEFKNSDIAAEVNMLRLNNEAVLKLTHYFTRIFTQWKRGGMIFLSSIVSFQGVPYAAHYAATKAYLQSLAEALAIELKPYHVDVLAAAPGPVKGNFETRANIKMNGGMQASHIAAPILKALGRKSSVWPGFLSKLLIGSLHTVPRFLKIRIMKLVMGGMTQHQRTTNL
ncbi:MAG: SDR family NAD(P)-dependent oxidoreductase [Chitinophagaceae bacterium]|nr:SDR family NAD(P)-dependent oxidoreductase [Chitinophagaceae bacterium]